MFSRAVHSSVVHGNSATSDILVHATASKPKGHYATTPRNHGTKDARAISQRDRLRAKLAQQRAEKEPKRVNDQQLKQLSTAPGIVLKFRYYDDGHDLSDSMYYWDERAREYCCRRRADCRFVHLANKHATLLSWLFMHGENDAPDYGLRTEEDVHDLLAHEEAELARMDPVRSAKQEWL